MKFSLVVISGATAGKEIPVRLPEFIIGRDPECHLRPASPMISKKHCSFVMQGERVLFKDYGSTNGSFINDVRVENEAYLKNGDLVKFGPLTFQVKLESTAVMQATPTLASSTGKTVADTVGSRAMASSSHAVKKAATAEDDIAAMLFNFADAPSGSIPADEIPMGSTIAGMVIDPTTIDQPALTDEQRRVEERKKTDAAKKAVNSASTSSAAEAILQKYMKRPRA